jgi:hypothetical protein
LSFGRHNGSRIAKRFAMIRHVPRRFGFMLIESVIIKEALAVILRTAERSGTERVPAAPTASTSALAAVPAVPAVSLIRFAPLTALSAKRICA